LNKIEAVVFDIDGTLYPNASMYWRSIPFALKNFGLLRAFNKVRKNIRKYELIEDFPALQIKLLAEEMKITPREAKEILEVSVFQDWFQVFKKLKLFTGLKEMLDDLQAREIPMGVMSDFPIRGRLQDLGVGDYWKIAFSSEDTGYLKPHRKPFEWISELLHVPIEKILYVGNSFQYDVLGAKSVGMMAAHVAKKAPQKQPCRHHLRSLS
jgi:putative hydrolase of the HAD superfamily